MQKWLLFGWLLLRWLLLGWLLLRWLFLGWLLLPFSICKTPLGEMGCLGNACFLLTGYLSIQFFGSPPFLTQSVRLPLATHSLCSTCITYGTSCHARGHGHFPPTLYRECYGFERAFFTLKPFLPYISSCCFQDLPGTGSSPSKVAGLHADHRNIALARLLFWNTAIHKRYTGRFYLCA